MSGPTLSDLRASVQDSTAFSVLDDYRQIGEVFLDYLANTAPTSIVSPRQPEYRFYQFGKEEDHKITRPLNSPLFLSDLARFRAAFERFAAFLEELRRRQERAAESAKGRKYLETNDVNRVVYTLQQSIGCIADSFSEANQARKRAGQLFENLVKLIIREVGLVCEPRTINLPIPGQDGYAMRYELDVVFSRNRAILAAETTAGALRPPEEEETVETQTPTPASQVEYIAAHEIVGSIKRVYGNSVRRGPEGPVCRKRSPPARAKCLC